MFQIKKNAWYDNELLPNEMVKSAKGEFINWKKFIFSTDFQAEKLTLC